MEQLLPKPHPCPEPDCPVTGDEKCQGCMAIAYLYPGATSEQITANESTSNGAGARRYAQVIGCKRASSS